MPADSSQYPFKGHPETCAPDDVWGQVKRTVHGQPVPAGQIELIVSAIRSGLHLEPDDMLLDLCCGNGALTTQLFALCCGGLGVDYSDFLIKVATDHFVRRSTEGYRVADALAYVAAEEDPARFTKALCYGAFPYFGEDAAFGLLATLHRRFTKITHLFLGQLPNRTQRDAFYAGRQPDEADNPGSALGLWRTPEEMIDLAHRTGWQTRCQRMPNAFFAAHYRFDAVLFR